jgi:hypothetical protein
LQWAKRLSSAGCKTEMSLAAEKEEPQYPCRKSTSPWSSSGPSEEGEKKSLGKNDRRVIFGIRMMLGSPVACGRLIAATGDDPKEEI